MMCNNCGYEKHYDEVCDVCSEITELTFESLSRADISDLQYEGRIEQ